MTQESAPMPERGVRNSLLCSDCGHHIHRPDACRWTFGAGMSKRDCGCSTERDVSPATRYETPAPAPWTPTGCFLVAQGVAAWQVSDVEQEAAAIERRKVVDRIRERFPGDWREQLELIQDATETPANAEQITLLDLSNKALRVLTALDKLSPPSSDRGASR